MTVNYFVLENIDDDEFSNRASQGEFRGATLSIHDTSFRAACLKQDYGISALRLENFTVPSFLHFFNGIHLDYIFAYGLRSDSYCLAGLSADTIHIDSCNKYVLPLDMSLTQNLSLTSRNVTSFEWLRGAKDLNTLILAACKVKKQTLLSLSEALDGFKINNIYIASLLSESLFRNISFEHQELFISNGASVWKGGVEVEFDSFMESHIDSVRRN